jgi:serine/threonine protein phosphatase 1
MFVLLKRTDQIMFIQHFARNEVGCDFCAGDIHGHFDMLEAKLKAIGFNPDTDRLFAAGDLINRGPYSNQVTHYLENEPWFHSVLGNHEQLLLEVLVGQYSEPEFAKNGGSWFLGLRREEKEAIARVIEKLPLGIQVETKKGIVGIVHAEVPKDDWHYFVQLTREIQTQRDYLRVSSSALWARDRIKTLRNNAVAGIAHVFVGHTPHEQIRTLGNVSYIDGGTYKPHGKLNVIPITQFNG